MPITDVPVSSRESAREETQQSLYYGSGHQPDSTATGSLTAVNQAHTMAVRQGDSTCSFDQAGTFVGTVAFEFSPDGGTTWRALNSVNVGNGVVANASNTSGAMWEAALPAAATHVRQRCSAYTSGTIVARTSLSATQYEPAVSVAGGVLALAAGVAEFGYAKAAGVEYDESVTPLAGGGTFTGTGRDVTGVATGSNFSSATARPQEARLSASADVPGTLYLEVSHDFATWRRVKAAVMKNIALDGSADASLVYYAEIIHRPSRRWVRAVFVCGATGQAHFLCSLQMLAA